VYIPCLSFKKDELKLKLEVVEHIDVDITSIYDINIDTSKTNLRIVLHDHNEIEVGLSKYAPYIIAIIDHHHDLGLYSSQLIYKHIEAVGSATSLVLSLIFKSGFDHIIGTRITKISIYRFL